MIYEFIYESNQYALLHGLRRCVLVQVSIDAPVISENTEFGQRQGLHKFHTRSIVTESGQDVLADFMGDKLLYKELRDEVFAREEAIITQYEALTA